jgi:phosphate transport system substrate-binding protein
MFSKSLNAAAAATVIIFATAGAASTDELRIGGTGAAQGLLQRLGGVFSASHPGDTLEVVSGLGSTGGISAAIEGALHLAVSGRPLKSGEREKGAKGTLLLDTPFIFVTSHPNKQKLTTANVIEVFNGKLTKWPDGKDIKPILRPKSDSASAYLVDNLSGMQVAMEVLRKRPDVPVAATDQDNVEAAVRIENSLTAMTLVQFTTERPDLRLIELDGAEPSVDAMKTDRYPLKTSLHLIQGPHSSGVADRFIAFIKTSVAEKIILESGGLAPSARTAAQ